MKIITVFIHKIFVTKVQYVSLLIYYSFSFKQLLRTVTSSKDSTIEFMQKQGILRSSVNCPGPLVNGSRLHGCGKPMQLKKTNDSKDTYVWRCRKIHKVIRNNGIYTVKDVKLSIQHQSWIVDAKLPLEIILELIYLWSQGFSQGEILHELKLSNKTVTEWTNFFRESCISAVIDNSTPIGGNGIEVEIDESKFGKWKYHKGHKVEGQWVFGCREKYNKKQFFMIPVCNRKEATLIPIIKKWIKPGSIIHSDCGKAYSKLKSLGYTHITVNHSKEFVNSESAACTNSIESDWRHAKLQMPSYGTHIGDHAGYLAEFMWRRSNCDKDKFLQLINDINQTFNKKYLSKLP